MSTDVRKILQARGSVYGPFPENARISQSIKDIMRDTPNWNSLPNDMREALDQTALKISRILSGDPEYLDNPMDIAGYMTRVAQRIEETHGLVKPGTNIIDQEQS